MSKLLITLSIPVIEMSFDVYVPINKKIGTIKKYLLKNLKEITEGELDISLERMRMIDKETGKEYDNNHYLKDSGIKNGSWIVVM